MKSERVVPLDLQSTRYSYIERPNRVLLELAARHVLETKPAARVLDVGCGCGANARHLRERHPGVRIVGIEPNARAAELARQACEAVFEGDVQGWLGTRDPEPFDAVILSDVLEHIADPFSFLRSLTTAPPLAGATYVISVPNYAVWYNRARTLAGRFEYAWSGLYDRTHLRFYTRASVQRLLLNCGLQVVADACSPSLVQSLAPLLRRLFESDVASGNHLSISEAKSFQTYEKLVEPLETKFCNLWPTLLGFQIVSVARRA